MNNFKYFAKATTPTLNTKFGHSKVEVAESKNATVTLKDFITAPNIFNRAISYKIYFVQMYDKFGRLREVLRQGEDPQESSMEYTSRLLNYDEHCGKNSPHPRSFEKQQN